MGRFPRSIGAAAWLIAAQPLFIWRACPYNEMSLSGLVVMWCSAGQPCLGHEAVHV
jgi:hypothetical protein